MELRKLDAACRVFQRLNRHSCGQLLFVYIADVEDSIVGFTLT